MGVLDASTSPLKERYAVSNDSVTKLIQPGTFDDQLTDVLRDPIRTKTTPGLCSAVTNGAITRVIID